MSDESRSYHSPLREGRVAETRTRILDAATTVLSQGAAQLTIPAVAREAGVAVPTVYRYFSTKEALEDAVADHVRGQIGVTDPVLDGTVEGWIAHVDQTWRTAAALPVSVQAVLLATIGRDLAEGKRRDRVERAHRILGPALEGRDPVQADRFVKVLTALSSTPGAVAFQRVGIDAGEAADLIGWVFHTLHQSLDHAEE